MKTMTSLFRFRADGSSKPRNLRTVIWGSLTMITCPCCVPLWIVLLSGTAAGAMLRENIYWAVGFFFIPFVFFAWKAMRSYGSNDRRRENSTSNGSPGSLP